MKFRALRFGWTSQGEVAVLFGFIAGRVSYEPDARWLYSFRLFLLFVKIEVNWITGKATP